ncbi:MAG TPA: DUF4159 domain-containing protein [Pyrinomonadaceae bacterium]|nr:DUF4159 domain-containing protein [Pyrinomonadaceae bacterium]
MRISSTQTWKRFPLKVIVCTILLCLLLVPSVAQNPFDDYSFRQRPTLVRPEATGPSFGEFTFIRTIYDSPYASYRRRGMWATDYPEADFNLIVGLREWAGTNLKIAARPEQIPIMDDRLFDYPLIYFVEPGFLELSDEQAARLREYVARGGFMFFDDFWGVYEIDNLETQLHKVWPNRTIKELPLTHPIFHSYLDIDETLQVPNIYNAIRGETSEKGGTVPHRMGIEDENGRLVVFISFNTDLGDAWEWINDPRYPAKYGLHAYKTAINVIIYAMSH